MWNQHPGLPGHVHVYPAAQDVCVALADHVFAAARKSVERHGDFHLALSGGQTPLPLYERLATDGAYSPFPWPQTHLWWVDERVVPLSDSRSNFGQFRRQFGASPMGSAQFHPMCSDNGQPTDYGEALRDALSHRPAHERCLDFICLGVGSDGHTASLFPHSAALHCENAWVTEVIAEAAVPKHRVTMTYPLLNAGSTIAVLVLGVGKAPILRRAATPNTAVLDLPICGIWPRTDDLHWYLDGLAQP